MWTIDATGVTDYINPQGSIPGYAAEEVLGRSPLTFVVAEDSRNGRGGSTASREGAARALSQRAVWVPFARRDGCRNGDQ